jgi:hypothetical protein
MSTTPRLSTVLATLAIALGCAMCGGSQSKQGNGATDAAAQSGSAIADGAAGQGGDASVAGAGHTSTGTLSSQGGAPAVQSSTHEGGTTASQGSSTAKTSSTREGGTKDTGQTGRAGSQGTTGAAGASGGDRADGGIRRDGSPDAPTLPDAPILPDARPEAGVSADPCQAAGLKWHSGAKTNYTSYPDPGSEECIKYNGCKWEGLFSACPKKRTLEWVQAHNIVAVFPDFASLKLHDLCLRSGKKTIVVTVLDECGDSDCDGCCTENRGSSDQLIDVESFTDARWGVEDGPIEWADLGATQGTGCQ